MWNFGTLYMHNNITGTFSFVVFKVLWGHSVHLSQNSLLLETSWRCSYMYLKMSMMVHWFNIFNVILTAVIKQNVKVHGPLVHIHHCVWHPLTNNPSTHAHFPKQPL